MRQKTAYDYVKSSRIPIEKITGVFCKSCHGYQLHERWYTPNNTQVTRCKQCGNEEAITECKRTGCLGCPDCVGLMHGIAGAD